MVTEGLYVGLMSGTSMDGIDAVLVHLADAAIELKGSHTTPVPAAIHARIRAVATGESDDLDTVARLSRDLAGLYAQCVGGLLEKAQTQAAEVLAVGSHGQTVRHHPSPDLSERYTVQIGDPSTIAELTGITTVADFRPRDIAAGGQGAPLAPAFHAACFGEDGERRAIINIGGIANVTLLDGKSVMRGFDTGPGNTLLDGWIRRQREEPFDAMGAWSAEHDLDDELLQRLAADDYFSADGPRSTGPERFNLAWLEQHLSGTEKPGDVQATLCELTVKTIAEALQGTGVTSAYVCGGGARNVDLMRRLHRRLGAGKVHLGVTDDLGLAAEWVEAAAWAWLAARTLAGLPGNETSVTGAEGPRILGGIYPA